MLSRKKYLWAPKIHKMENERRAICKGGFIKMHKNAPLTIAERIRQAGGKADEEIATGKSAPGASLLSLDEQIAALEAGGSGSDSDSNSDTDSDSGSDSTSDRQESEEEGGRGAPLKEVDAAGRVVRLVSSLAAERIAPLSRSLLPGAHCGARSLKPGQLAHDERPPKSKVPRAIRFADEDTAAARGAGAGTDKRESRKRPRAEDSASRAGSPSASAASSAGRASEISGMEATVRELLRSYQPASAARKPFWCRVCQHQAIDEASLLEHRASEFHAVAARMEAKASRCELCRKQFTSPLQLQEHLRSKLHKQRLEYVKAGQAQRKKFS